MGYMGHSSCSMFVKCWFAERVLGTYFSLLPHPLNFSPAISSFNTVKACEMTRPVTSGWQPPTYTPVIRLYGTPLQYSCLENPMDGGAWWAAAMGSLRVGHDWATSLSLFTFMLWRRKWQPTPVFLPGESQGQRGLPSMGLHRVRHDWSDLAAAAALLIQSGMQWEIPPLWAWKWDVLVRY